MTAPAPGSPPPSFFGLTPEEAEEQLVEMGARPFHARVVRREVLERGLLGYEEMTGLPRELRERLTERLPLVSAREITRSEATDGTIKFLLRFPDGASVESVRIPSSRKNARGATLCVSSQAGCAMGCPFCASGRAGLVRNLEAHEILEQFLLARTGGPLSRVVVMGIGEPLLNLDAVRGALDTVRSELGIGARKLTVSTIGFPERVKRLAADRPRFQLAISLHSPFDEERQRLVPAMSEVSVEEVLQGGDVWFERTGRELTYEYVLLGGTNDTEAHAVRLAERLRDRRATVNLIPFNTIADASFRRPRGEDVAAFFEILNEANVVATVRRSRGADRDAACGQLRLRRGPGA
jgi:23S rRNA (adenine2503-C2)-methyltransferase